MIDTHCHLYSEEFKDDIGEVIEKANRSGISKFYLPAIDSTTNASMLKLEETFTGSCFAMMGLHPCSVKENYLEELQLVRDWLDKRKFAGVGETGLDYYWDKTFKKHQEYALEYQVELALRHNLPIILHTRDAMRETIDIIKNFTSRGLKGIFHCFGGSVREAEEIIAMGFYLGIGGIITYKNSGLEKILPSVGLQYLVLETDSPYLAPVPYRGKRNEPRHLTQVAMKLAEITNTSVEEVDSVTTRNAEQIFA